MTGLGYRRDIDGLRALAIIPVVLFHFGFNGFFGGFVGVDVFFVISGYLITSIIWRERQAGRFRFSAFWARRARRILPSLGIVMASALLAGWFLFIPEDYANLGRAVRYQSLFTANFLFMNTQGYFDSAEQFQPLLHTWSLAVEEQFYLFFPLLLAILSTRLARWRSALLALCCLSFGLSLWALSNHPRAAFYMLPMRAWELLLGALLALVPAGPWRLRPWCHEVLSGAGLLAILVAVLGFDAHTAFPGWAALLPAAGAAALIWANGQRDTRVGRLLGTRPLVGIGLISYAWYLWHWPIWVFASYVAMGEGFSLGQRLLLLALSLLLGYLSWRFIETPVRERRVFHSQRSLVLASLGGFLLLALIGQTLRWADGIPERLPAAALRYAEATKWQAGQMNCMFEGRPLSVSSVCHFGPEAAPRAFVWGDSHAAALVPAIQAQADRHRIPIWLATQSACPPLVDLATSATCRDFNAEALRIIHQQHVTDVLLAARWGLYVFGDNSGDNTWVISAPGRHPPDPAYARQHLAEALRATVASLRASGVRVWLLKEVPLQDKKVPRVLSRLAMLGHPTAGFGRPLSELQSRQAYLEPVFAGLEGVHLLDPMALFCADGRTCIAEEGGNALYRDDNHLSDTGSLKMQTLFEALFIASENAKTPAQ